MTQRHSDRVFLEPHRREKYTFQVEMDAVYRDRAYREELIFIG